MTTYTLKHQDGTIVETFKYPSSAIQFQREYHRKFGERLIIEREDEKWKITRILGNFVRVVGKNQKEFGNIKD